MSATSRPLHRSPRPLASREAVDERHAVRPVLALVALAVLAGIVVGTFAGILLFVCGLAALAAYAATHPDRA